MTILEIIKEDGLYRSDKTKTGFIYEVRGGVLFAQEIKIEVKGAEPPKSITLNVNDADFIKSLDKFINENAE